MRKGNFGISPSDRKQCRAHQCPSALLALLGAGERRPAGNEELFVATLAAQVRYLRLISNVTIEKKDVKSFPLGCLQTSIKQWCFSQGCEQVLAGALRSVHCSPGLRSKGEKEKAEERLCVILKI